MVDPKGKTMADKFSPQVQQAILESECFSAQERFCKWYSPENVQLPDQGCDYNVQKLQNKMINKQTRNTEKNQNGGQTSRQQFSFITLYNSQLLIHPFLSITQETLVNANRW